MKLHAIGFVVVAACSGSSAGDNTGDDSPPTPVVSASGMVSNPVSAIQSGRLIVGVAAPADVPQKIICDKLITKFDKPAVTLPATFQLDNIPAGRWVLVALLVDGSGATQMPGASYEIQADGSGVRFSTGSSDGPLEVFMQGTIGFDCP